MANPQIRIKRSAVSGKIPTPDQVPLGELALNTFDGRLFASKNVGLGTTVIAINPWSVGVGTDAYDTYFTQGNVGVGSTLPTSKLDVIGDVNVSGVVTASDGRLISGVGIQSGGTLIGTGVTTINIIGTGHTVNISGSTANITIDSGESSTQTPARTVTSYNATSGISTYNVTYQVGYLDVFLNGARLNSDEFTATNGTSVTLNEGPSEGDVLDLIYFSLGIGDTGPQGIQGIQGDSYWVPTGVGIHTLGNVGVGTTNPRFSLEVGSVGSATTSLWVNGDARITGILTIGTASLTLDGNNNIIKIGTGVTLTESGNASYIGVITATTFNGQINAGVGTITTLNGTDVTYTTGNFTTGNIVTGVVTTLSGTTATYGTGNFTTGNIVTGIVTTLTSTNATLTNINSAGISTLGVTSATNLTAQQLNISGLSTFSGITTHTAALFGPQASFTGVVTATTFSGSLTGNVTGNLNSTGINTVGSGSTSAPSITPTGDPNTGIFFPSADTIAFAEGGAEAARIDSSGRLLVGTSSARASDGVTPRYFQEGSDTYEALGVCSNGGTEAGKGAFIFLSRSRGTTAGSSTLVANGDALGAINFYGADGTDIQTSAAVIRCEVDGTPGANDMPGRLVFSTTADEASSPTERMRITNGHDVRIGSSPGGMNFGATLNVNEGGSNSKSVINNWAETSSYTGIMNNCYTNTTAGTGFKFYQGNAGISGNVYNVFGNGNVTNANNSYGAISDIKLKENIVDANSQWDDLKALQVRNYNFKEGQTHTQIGLVAQEAELVSPGLVSESPDRDNEGNDLGTVTKSINYSVLYMKAVKALQEAMERIETLEAKVSTLEAA